MTTGDEPRRDGSDAVVSGHKVSTVLPASVTGNVEHRLSGADLAAKLHYIKAVYYFRACAAVGGLTISDLKGPMFPWLDGYFMAAGRVRRPSDGGGRPFIKCNDCGVRIIEAECRLSMEEWLAADRPSRERLLSSEKVIGPDSQFSPLVYVQFTKFKCGGLAVGLSWAHLLGDIAAAVRCLNDWARLVCKGGAARAPDKPAADVADESSFAAPVPLISVKTIEQVGDCWYPPPSKHKMSSCSFKIGEPAVKALKTKAASDGVVVGEFELISAVVWRCLATVRSAAGELATVTVCKNASPAIAVGLNNGQRIGYVKADSAATKTDVVELAALLAQNFVDETAAVASLVGESGEGDVLLYGGANLTFVDALDADVYGLELVGLRPDNVEMCIDGVGDEGTVLIYRGGDAGTAMAVTAVLPAEEAAALPAMVREMVRNLELEMK